MVLSQHVESPGPSTIGKNLRSLLYSRLSKVKDGHHVEGRVSA